MIGWMKKYFLKLVNHSSICFTQVLSKSAMLLPMGRLKLLAKRSTWICLLICNKFRAACTKIQLKLPNELPKQTKSTFYSRCDEGMCVKFLRCLWFEHRAKVSLLVVRNGTNQYKHVKPTRMETLIQSTDVRKKQNIVNSLIF